MTATTASSESPSSRRSAQSLSSVGVTPPFSLILAAKGNDFKTVCALVLFLSPPPPPHPHFLGLPALHSPSRPPKSVTLAYPP